MRRRFSLLVAAALAVAPLACSRESAPAPPPRPAAETPPSGEASTKATKAELEQKLDDYLGREKQAYGREAREALDAKQRADLDIPVPPVDSLEVEKPDLRVPAPEEPVERP